MHRRSECSAAVAARGARGAAAVISFPADEHCRPKPFRPPLRPRQGDSPRRGRQPRARLLRRRRRPAVHPAGPRRPDRGPRIGRTDTPPPSPDRVPAWHTGPAGATCSIRRGPGPSRPGRAAVLVAQRPQPLQEPLLGEDDAHVDDDPVQVAFTGGVADMRVLAGRVRRLPCARTLTVTLTEYEQRDFSLLDVIAEGCSKGAALRDWAARRQVPQAAIMAVGDNLNDVDMLELAGHPVVMGNAGGRAQALRVAADGRSRRGGAGPRDSRPGAPSLAGNRRASGEEADELKWAAPGSAPCGEERTGPAGRAGQSARISPDADGAFGRAQPHGHTGFTERLPVHRPHPSTVHVRLGSSSSIQSRIVHETVHGRRGSSINY